MADSSRHPHYLVPANFNFAPATRYHHRQRDDNQRDKQTQSDSC